MQSNLAMIEVLAKGLGDLKKKTVFVGGATVSIYLKNKSSELLRLTSCLGEIRF
jgi:hypothetical protein